VWPVLLDSSKRQYEIVTDPDRIRSSTSIQVSRSSLTSGSDCGLLW
jgi:hypothetical protein